MIGESLFLAFLDIADSIAIDTIWQKYTFRQKSGVSVIVCREKVKRNRILWLLAERYIILSVNAVEIWGNGESRIRFGESETIWQKWRFCQIVYGEIDRK
ncbi:MAG: hypothetical protein K2O59_17050 [Lachnospiraceae bacterium]|nr:hypothetical protein [Lachnospiraceae bacterium]